MEFKCFEVRNGIERGLKRVNPHREPDIHLTLALLTVKQHPSKGETKQASLPLANEPLPPGQ